MGTTAAKLEALLSTKTDIKRAIEAKGQEVGDIPFSQYPAKIDAITTTPSPQPVGWQPNPTWWDIEKILDEDTEDIGTGGKCIFLLADADIATLMNFQQWFYKIKTSDGAEYVTNVTHLWDTSKDKECNFGYNTRYVICYTTSADKDFGEACKIMFNRVCLYCVFDWCNFNGASFGSASRTNICNMLQSAMFKNAGGVISSSTNAFGYCSSLVSITLPHCFAYSMRFNSAFQNCSSLVSVTLPEYWVAPPEALTNIFGWCTSLLSVTLPARFWEQPNSLTSTFNSCISLTSLPIRDGSIIRCSVNLSSTYLNKKSLLGIIGSLEDRVGLSGLGLNLGARHIEMLTIAEKLVATNKNWTLS